MSNAIARFQDRHWMVKKRKNKKEREVVEERGEKTDEQMCGRKRMRAATYSKYELILLELLGPFKGQLVLFRWVLMGRWGQYWGASAYVLFLNGDCSYSFYSKSLTQTRPCILHPFALSLPHPITLFFHSLSPSLSLSVYTLSVPHSFLCISICPPLWK